MAFDYNKLMMNPLFQTGLGILGQSGPSQQNLGQRLSSGALSGLQNTLSMRQSDRQRLKDEMQMKAAQRKQTQDAALGQATQEMLFQQPQGTETPGQIAAAQGVDMGMSGGDAYKMYQDSMAAAPKEPVYGVKKMENPEGKMESWLTVDGIPTQNLMTGAVKGSGVQINLASEKGFENETVLRKEFDANPVAKTYGIVQKQAGRVEKVEQALEEYRKNPAGKSLMPVDQALITIYNKMLDESSVVRESEYARTSKDQALLSSIRGRIDKIMSGGAGLTDTERKSLIGMIYEFNDVAKDKYYGHAGRYADLAEEYGFSSGRIIGKKTITDMEDWKKRSDGGIDMTDPAIKALNLPPGARVIGVRQQ